VLVRSYGVCDVDLRVYEGSLKAKVASWPLEIERLHFTRRPAPIQALSRFRGTIADKYMCSIVRIKARIEGDALLLHGERRGDAPAVDFRFDLKSKQWSATAREGTKVLRDD